MERSSRRCRHTKELKKRRDAEDQRIVGPSRKSLLTDYNTEGVGVARLVEQMGLSSGDIFNSKSMNKPKPQASKAAESSDARERFSNAKSISSSQFHGTDAADARQTEETLSRYSGSKVGSSHTNRWATKQGTSALGFLAYSSFPREDPRSQQLGDPLIVKR